MTKKYVLSVVEEMVQNPDYQWGRGGRIEVYEQDKEYAIEEYRFFIPKELFESFCDAFDGKETNHPVRIVMDWKII